ncbi:MAG: hypothetical protein ACTSPB_06435 [Candidatus Thorarchaeota archaeon]
MKRRLDGAWNWEIDDSLMYLPAEHYPTMGRKRDFKPNGKTMYYWKKTDFFTYPAFLISPFDILFCGSRSFYKGPVRDGFNLRDKFKIPKEMHIVGDSGAFGARAKNVKPVSRLLMDWYRDNCDVGFIFDWIPYLDENKAIRGKLDNFDKNLERTVETTEEMLRHYDESFEFWSIVHGTTTEELEKWRRRLDDLFSWGGYAVAPKPSDSIDALIETLRYVQDHIHTPIHILGVSGTVAIGVIAWWQHNIFKQRVTFDSSSYTGMRKDLQNPLKFGSKFRFMRDDASKLACRPADVPCWCPVCLGLRETRSVNFLWENTTAESAAYIALHNIFYYVWYTESCKALATEKDIDKYISYLPARGRSRKFIRKALVALTDDETPEQSTTLEDEW